MAKVSRQEAAVIEDDGQSMVAARYHRLSSGELIEARGKLADACDETVLHRRPLEAISVHSAGARHCCQGPTKMDCMVDCRCCHYARIVCRLDYLVV